MSKLSEHQKSLRLIIKCLSNWVEEPDLVAWLDRARLEAEGDEVLVKAVSAVILAPIKSRLAHAQTLIVMLKGMLS